MSEPKQRIIESNGIHLNIAEQGDGPVALLAHGWPESWYSWRHQLGALAAAGFHAVAPDMRGYGKSDAPEAIDKYTLFHLVGDMVGVLDALGAEKAVIVGHDWGAIVAWQAALLRPDRFRAVAAMSVPFYPRGMSLRTALMPRTENARFYMLYFQEPGLAEAEFGRDPRTTLRNLLFAGSGDGVALARAAQASGGPSENFAMVPNGGESLRGSGAPAALPSWITKKDIDFYGEEFRRTGFRGGLNYYRNIDRNWELLGAMAGLRVSVPALFMAGDHDLVISFPGTEQVLANLKNLVPGLRGIKMLAGCGHWTQQERPEEVNAALLEFLQSLSDHTDDGA